MKLKFSKKRLVITYIITTIICSILTIKFSNVSGNWYTNLNVLIRLTLFLANCTLPVIMWISYFSVITLNHHNIVSKRDYIWKFRNRIFKIRKQYFIFYLIISFITSAFSLFYVKIDYATLLGLFTLTIAINLINWYLVHEKFLISISNSTSKRKIYNKDYIAEKHDENIFEVIQTPKYDAPKYSLFDRHTINTVYTLCNNNIFCEDNIDNIYKTLNLIDQKPFKIKQRVRFMSLINLLEFEKKVDKKSISKILNNFGYDYKSDYISNRRKHIKKDILEDDKVSFEEKIELIINSKA